MSDVTLVASWRTLSVRGLTPKVYPSSASKPPHRVIDVSSGNIDIVVVGVKDDSSLSNHLW